MKRKLSTLLALGLCANLFTISACADEVSEEWKNNTGEINLTALTATGNGVSIENNVITITQGGDFTVAGTLEDGMIYVNTESRVKLRLSGVSITNTKGPAIFFDNVDKGFITLTENTDNFLYDAKEYTVEEADAALFSNDDLEIKGDGSLTVTGNFKHGIAGDDDVNIESGNISITSFEHSIKVNDTLHITGGAITSVSQTGKPIKAGLELIIDDGTFDLTAEESEGMESKGILTINGGNLKITAKDDGINTGNEDTTQDAATTPNGEKPNKDFPGRSENMTPPEGMIPPDGMFPPEGMMPPEGMFPPDGMIPPQRPQNEPDFKGHGGFGGGFGKVDEETAQAHAITINGGKIYINTQCDGIDSNGHLTITGGEITVDGPARGGNGPLDAQGKFSVTGGSIITTSSAGMLQTPETLENVKLVQVYFTDTQKGGTKLSVTNADDTLINLTPENDYQTMLLISGDLSEDVQYSVLLNDEVYESFTVKGEKTTVGTPSFNRGGFGNGQPSGRGQKQNRNRIRVSLNGQNLFFDSEPVIKNDTTLVGFRTILEALGATVSWDEETKTVTATKDDVIITLKIGSDKAFVNDNEVSLLTPPEIINDRTMIPVRFVSESLDMSVDWDDATRHVIIKDKK